ncbi:MAG: 4-hydroxythreonine-4-phosphate dehydrogenase PdxA [Tannerella sp.]|jgi:4-hydroxythreonine-4-phosphate dehydrogenase|nr:4-hydroxythreonine-4-phosphate dehydrogenase PdxA [Tannerella sp.]
MEEKLIKIGISQGDSNGIGYEIILKAFSDQRMFELCIPVLYGSNKIASFYGKLLENAEIAPPEIQVIQDAAKAVQGKLNLIRCVDDSAPVEPGRSTRAGGKASFQSLEAVVADLKKGTVQALLTAPVNKHNIQNDKFHFPGHTEYLEKKFSDGGARKSLMILLNEQLRVALATGHIPLSEVKSKLTTEGIAEKLMIFNRSLCEDFGILRPRIAVLALNPHAGDNGLIGKEEIEIIRPAIEEADKNGVFVFGPYAADGFFGAQTYRLFDGIVAMYHDQGLAPFKALAMDDGVNFTAGLPIVRTSPAHGTAYDIAGKNEASASSFRHALYTLIDVCGNRKNYFAATANPLRKQYVDRSGDKEKLDLTKEE